MNTPNRILRGVAALLLGSVLLVSFATAADIVAEEGWARATPPGVKLGAGYITLRNTGTDTHNLLRLTSTVSDDLSLHLSSVDANGVAHMWPLAKLELKPGEQVRFEPNGKHIMFSDLKNPLVAGASVPVTFQFDHGEPPLTVQFEVRPLVPDAKGKPKPMDHMNMDPSSMSHSKH